jgi:diadenylate cyclase
MLPTGSFRLVDFIDIFIFAVVVYVTLLLTIRGASRRAAIALLFVGLLYLFAKQWQLYLTLAVLEFGFFIVLIAIAIVYQDDIRWASERVSQWIAGTTKRTTGLSDFPNQIAETISDVAFLLAEQKIGALIVIRGRDDLRLHIDGGTELDAIPSAPLLRSLFDPSTPGHDGAIIIENGRISWFGTHLPLAKPNGRADDRGTRHHAALGLSDVSDALIIVVSEERGTISIAKAREIKKITLARHLESIICDQMSGLGATERRSPTRKFLRERPVLKIASLLIATVGWWMVVYDSNQIYRTFVVPIEYRNVPKTLPLGDNLVNEARVTLSGTENAFRFLAPSTLSISLDVEAIANGQRRFSVTEAMVRAPSNLRVTGIEPRAISVIPAKEAKRFPSPIGLGEP